MTSARTYGLQVGIAVALAVASMWAATQWAAAALGYQPALGGAWLETLGLKVYAPWKLFAWWLAFEPQAPDVFARAGLIAASGGLACGVVAIGGAAQRTSRKVQPTTYGSARWADISDVRKASLLSDRGIVLGLYGDRYLRHDGPEHVLAVAPTRSGKGVGLVLPTLLTWPGSAVTRLDKVWSELVTSSSADDETRPLPRVIPRPKKDKDKPDRPLSDLPLFAASLSVPVIEVDALAAGEELDKVIQFPGLRL